MVKLHISETIRIDATPAAVYAIVSDFHHWAAWSPWMIQEPEATTIVQPDGKSYSWEGKRVGSGNMKVTGEEVGRNIDYDLNFIKPFKSHATVRFELRDVGGGTEVTWLLDTGLPFFLFWMKKSMTTFLHMDYRRGLTMLKDYAETGNVPSRLEFTGVVEFPGMRYVGIRGESSTADMGPSMSAAFDRVWTLVKDSSLQPAGAPVAIYHKFDPVAGRASFTCGAPVTDLPAQLPSGIISGSIPAMKVYQLRHVGAYRHLPNGWTTANNLIQNKVFKVDPRHPPFEMYRNMPGEVEDKDLITDIFYGVK
ncbi:MAG: hypothetical protein RLZZ385_1431 [Pseudomonadota bacterium]|jgi:DNA gyrase inhibitor GyrI